MVLDEFKGGNNQPKKTLDKRNKQLIGSIKINISDILDGDQEDIKNIINSIKDWLNISLSHAGDNLGRAKSSFNGLSQKQMQEKYGQSGQTKQQILDGYQKNYDEYLRAIDILEKVLNGFTITKKEIEKYRGKILSAISQKLSSDGDNLGRAKSSFNGLSQEQMQEEHLQSGQTKQQILDGYQKNYDKTIKAEEFLEGLFSKFDL